MPEENHELIAKHVEFVKVFDSQIKTNLNSKDRKFSLPKILQILDKYGVIKLAQDQPKASFVNLYEKANGLQSTNDEFSQEKWTDFYQ